MRLLARPGPGPGPGSRVRAWFSSLFQSDSESAYVQLEILPEVSFILVFDIHHQGHGLTSHDRAKLDTVYPQMIMIMIMIMEKQHHQRRTNCQ